MKNKEALEVNWKTTHKEYGDITIKTINFGNGYMWIDNDKIPTFGHDSDHAKMCYPTIPMLLLKELEKALTQEVSDDIVINKVNQAIHTLEKHKNIANATYVNEVEEISKDTKVEEITNKLRTLCQIAINYGAKSDEVDEFYYPLLNYISNMPKEVEDEDIQQMFKLHYGNNHIWLKWYEDGVMSAIRELQTGIHYESKKPLTARQLRDIRNGLLDYGLSKGEIERYEDESWKFVDDYTKKQLNVPNQSAKEFLDEFKETGTKIICNEDVSVDIVEPTKCNCDICKCETKQDYVDVLCKQIREVLIDDIRPMEMSRAKYIQYLVESTIELMQEVDND